LPNNDIPNEPRLIDATPSSKTTTIDRSKVDSDPLPPLDEPPPPIQTGNKSPGLGGPTTDDLPPIPDVPEPGAPPAPLRSKYQSNHQSIPTPPSGADVPPVIPTKSGGDLDKAK